MEEVEEKLQHLIARLEESDGDAKETLRGSLGEPRVLALHVPDLGADYWTVLEDGGMTPLQRGEPEEAHIRIRLTSDDLVAMVDGELGLVPAFVTGRIKVDASFTDMLQLRKML